MGNTEYINSIQHLEKKWKKKKRNWQSLSTSKYSFTFIALGALSLSNVYNTLQKYSPQEPNCGRCEQRVKQMWYARVTLITFRFKPTRVSLVGLIFRSVPQSQRRPKSLSQGGEHNHPDNKMRSAPLSIQWSVVHLLRLHTCAFNTPMLSALIYRVNYLE